MLRILITFNELNEVEVTNYIIVEFYKLMYYTKAKDNLKNKNKVYLILLVCVTKQKLFYGKTNKIENFCKKS